MWIRNAVLASLTTLSSGCIGDSGAGGAGGGASGPTGDAGPSTGGTNAGGGGGQPGGGGHTGGAAGHGGAVQPGGEAGQGGAQPGGEAGQGGSAGAGAPDAQLGPGDLDDDGIENSVDNCPGAANNNQLDTDADGVGDLCDRCPVDPDPAQLDTDRDGTGDACDVCPEASSAEFSHADGDRDGVAACAGDCEDTDPAIGPARAEVCNGHDDNCDTRADETFPDLGTPCTAGRGACLREGEQICTANGEDTMCSARAAAAAAERCDGLDNDCDGEVDEALLGCCTPGEQGPCGVDVGACTAGTRVCQPDQSWGQCNDVGPVPEVCNGVDDDCNGQADEGLGQQFCGQGLCRRPLANCVGGHAGPCDPMLGATPERCNGLDDDCDGRIDNGFDLQADLNNCGACGNVCGPGEPCDQGRCGGLFVFAEVGLEVPEADLQGWRQCESTDYGQVYPLVDLLTHCDGDFIAYGCRFSGSPDFAVLAMGDRDLVFADTGDANNRVTTTNGVSFYFSGNTSIGFVPEGLVPERNQCDVGSDRGAERMCVHTQNDSLSAGWRCGESVDIGVAWERVFFTASGPRPACENGLDDDGDGRTDYPFDPGCRATLDSTEADPPAVATPDCANGRDDDGDGRSDYPDDFDCVAAGDDDETGMQVGPVCRNGEDEDHDGRIDFPDDPGCDSPHDGDEFNDGFAPRCADGADNDADGALDLGDRGCQNALDDDEVDPARAPECANGRDDDADGRTDWPADPGCLGRGDLIESEACPPGVVPVAVPAAGFIDAATMLQGPDNHRASCGGDGAPDRVFTYTLAAPGDLTVALDPARTAFPGVISVQSQCADAASTLACAAANAGGQPALTIPALPAGTYFIFVDGNPPNGWVSSGLPIDFPPSPDGFQAVQEDLGPEGWADGGNDAFDTFGQLDVTRGATTETLDVSEGVREGQIEDSAYRLVSEFAHPNVWRLRLEPAVVGDDNVVDVVISGNMGCDQDCLEHATIAKDGQDIPYFTSFDPSDPETVQMLVPSVVGELAQVTYSNDADNVRISAVGVHLPVTLYVGLTNGDVALAAQSLIDDLTASGPGVGGNNSGNFRLTARTR